jgi:NADP-dependent 3-hydroxy acid dehydrogenase YdfG
VLAARSEDKLAALAEELGGADRALAVRCDVTEWPEQEAMVGRTLDAFGRLDVVFANGRPRHADRARHGRHAVLRQPRRPARSRPTTSPPP